MKRNLYNNSLKAIAIGMAVAMGGSTAISGVVNSAVVAYAEAPDFTASAEKSVNDLKLTLTGNSAKNFNHSGGSLTALKITSGDGSVVYVDSSNPTSDGITLGEASSSNTLEITVPKAQLKNLTGEETELKIVTLTSSDVTFDSSNLNIASPEDGVVVTVSGSLGIDVVKPTIKSGVVENANKKEIVLTFSENIKAETAPTATDFTVKVGSDSQKDNVVTAVNFATTATGNTATLTLTDDIVNTDVIKLTYTNSGNNITDDAGNVLENVSEAIAITNNVAAPNQAPTISTGVIENAKPSEIVLTFSENIKVSAEDRQPAKEDFTVMVGEQKVNVTGISKISTTADSSAVTLTLEKAVSKGDLVTVAYVKGTNPIQDADGADLENTYSPVSITNNVQNEIVSVTNTNGTYTFVKNEDGKSVTLTGFSKTTVKSRATNTVKFENGVLTENDKTYNLTAIGDGSNSLSEIDNKALENNTKYVTTVKANAFKGATNLTSINLESVTSIGSNAFNGCTSLKEVKLGTNNGNKAIDIPTNAFNGCSALSKVETNTASQDKVNDAVKESGSKDVTVTVPSNNNNNSSSGGSSGGGAVINAKPNDTTTEGTSSQETTSTPIVEDKDLTLDVISLPSVEGEAKVFGDVDANHWAKAHIDKLSTAGVINGANGMFNPNGQTKRADVTIMLVNLLGLSPEANNKFADVNPSAYYAPYVGTASTYGIVNGSNGMFNPEGIISRQDTMVMIAQILKSLDLNVNTDATVLNQFSDASKVAPYANESVAILVNSGIISGNNGKLNPTSPVTRAEMATIMSKLYDVLAEAK